MREKFNFFRREKMRIRATIAILLVGLFVGNTFADYDLILTGIQDYNIPVSYSNKNILVADSAFVVYKSGLSFENCIMDVNGSIECNSNITLVNSVVRTKGSFKVQPGITITETGASSIIATGDTQYAGKVIIEGEISNRITAISDYVSGSDAEFIILEADSSSDSSLKCIDFYGGWVNIQIYNKRLNDAISNCCFYGADYAIWQDGIEELTTISFSVFCQNYLSVYAGVDGATRTNINPLIDNVVIDGSDFGVVLTGQQTVPYFDYLELTNSIITNCYCGWYIDADSFYQPRMANIAYYNNDWDDNLSDSSFQQNPMYLTQNPFEEQEEPEDWPYFIKPDSPVADVNLGYDIWQSPPEQMLTSLFKSPIPRTSKGIGFGVPLPSGYFSNVYNLEGDFDGTGMVDFIDFTYFALEWRSKKDFINYSVADFDHNKVVDIFDLEILANNWLSSIADSNNGDINGDNKVNFLDYSIFASEWQTTESNSVHFPDANGYSIADFDYSGTVDILDFARFTDNWLAKSGIDLVIDDNENLLTVTCQSIQEPNVAYYAFFLDGKYIASRDSENSPTLIIDKTRYSKGPHYLRAVIKTENGDEYLTANQVVVFNSPLYDLSFSELFDPDKKFTITGRLDAGYSATIQIKNLDNQILWSNVYADDFITTIDADTFSSGEVDYKICYSYEPNILELFAGDLAGALFGSSGFVSGESSILALDGPPSSVVAGLVLCMMEEGMKEGGDELSTGTCRFASQMMGGKGIKVIILKGYGGNNQVRRGMINRVFRKYPNIRYGHIYAHGNYETDGAGIFGFDVRRTRLLFNDGEWVAFNSKKWTDRGLPVPAGYEYLSDSLERAHYLNQIPLAPGKLKILVIESCYALRNIVTIDSDGLCHYKNWQYEWEANNHVNSSYSYDYPYSDICAGLNMTGNQFVLGGGEVIIKGPYPYYSRFFNYFWRGLSNGDTTLNAWQYAYNESGATVEVQYKHRWRGNGIGVTLSSN
jgi:hypothetical protein